MHKRYLNNDNRWYLKAVSFHSKLRHETFPCIISTAYHLIPVCLLGGTALSKNAASKQHRFKQIMMKECSKCLPPSFTPSQRGAKIVQGGK